MPLPSFGPISLSQVNVELDKSATALISMNDVDVRTLAGVASGAISMSDLLGKSAGPAKADTTWSVVITTTTESTNYPAGIRNGDAVFVFLQQAANIPGPQPTFFFNPYGTKLAGFAGIAFSPQTNLYFHNQSSVYFIAGTDTMSGTPAGTGGLSVARCRYVVFRRSPDYFDTPVLSFLGTEATTLQFPSQAVAYTGSPSVILGMATASSVSSNVQSVTIGGVTPTLYSTNRSTADFVRLWYRPNIIPSTLTTVGTQNGTSGTGRWCPFVVH
jgi:hypothetical protein